jgi:tRNA-Thr(GGU) m(6)t(6)A37 methyltransferase TsaA
MASNRNTRGRVQIEYHAIGVVRSPFFATAGMPIQPSGAMGARGTVEVWPEYADGLSDLGGFTHVILLYHFHRASATRLTVTPFLDSVPRGVFATRAPCRPNPIGLSIVRLNRVVGTALHVEDIDILDGTPLLDIKPYVPEFDERPEAQVGWLAKASGHVQSKRSDDRFG